MRGDQVEEAVDEVGDLEVEDVMSARRPKVKQSVDIDMPIMVRNCKCQP